MPTSIGPRCFGLLVAATTDWSSHAGTFFGSGAVSGCVAAPCVLAGALGGVDSDGRLPDVAIVNVSTVFELIKG